MLDACTGKVCDARNIHDKNVEIENNVIFEENALHAKFFIIFFQFYQY